MDPRLQDDLQWSNERYLEMIAHMAQHDETSSTRLIAQIKRELMTLDPAGRRRAAERPFLLVDFRFRDEAWWRSARLSAIKQRSEVWTSSFPRRAAVDLARHVLTIAWVTASGAYAGPNTAQLGIAPRVAQVISGLKLEEMERIADRHVLLLRPRWEDRPDLWRRLFEAARANQPEELQSIDVHGVQLLASDLLAQSG